MTVTVFLDSDEITAESFAVSVERGRSLESETFGPGGGTVRVRNYEANFNPYFLVSTDAILLENADDLLRENGDRLLLESGNGTGAGSYGEIKLGRKVIVKDGAVTVFTGFVEDLDFEYDADGRAEAIITVRDALATLGATDLKGWAPSQQLTGARVSALLNRTEVGFPTGAAARDIATGTQPLQAGESTTNDNGSISYGTGSVSFGRNALQELQRINRAENGRLYVDAAGKLWFTDRYAVFGLTPTATFDDTGSNLPFHDIDIRFGTELLHFSVSVTREGSDIEQTATNDSLITEYANLGVRHHTESNLPYNSDWHTLGLANLLLNRFAQFKAVISGLTVKLGDLSTADRATVCGLDIGDVVTVTWTPTGTTGNVSQVLAIEAVNYTVYEFEGTAEVSFQLSDASDPDYFQVNTDSVNGPQFLAP